MAQVKKKTWPAWFEKILSGEKAYDFRLNDFDLEVGDTVVFEEWDPETKDYTGRSIEKEVTYLSKFKIDELEWWTKEEIEEKGFLIMSLK